MKYAILALLFWLCIGFSPVAADSPSTSHQEAATELLKLMDVEASMLSAASAMTDAMIQQNPTMEPYRDVLLDWAGSFMTWETFGPKYVALYVDVFTESELRELIGFYKTPTGKKALALMPELMQRGMALGAEVANEHSGELEEMIRERAAQLEDGSLE